MTFFQDFAFVPPVSDRVQLGRFVTHRCYLVFSCKVVILWLITDVVVINPTHFVVILCLQTVCLLIINCLLRIAKWHNC